MTPGSTRTPTRACRARRHRMSGIFSAQFAGGGDDRLQLLEGRVGGVHRALGEGAEAAVRVQKDLVRVEVLERLLDAVDNEARRLDIAARVDHAQADLAR